jgi:hypothetical protein
VTPMQRELYPDNWEEMAHALKHAAGWRCQQCGVQCRRPWDPIETRPILTVAHLNHIPADCRDENLRAMCAPCHLRYDARMHAAHARDTRNAANDPRQGQLWEDGDGTG